MATINKYNLDAKNKNKKQVIYIFLTRQISNQIKIPKKGAYMKNNNIPELCVQPVQKTSSTNFGVYIQLQSHYSCTAGKKCFYPIDIYQD